MKEPNMVVWLVGAVLLLGLCLLPGLIAKARGHANQNAILLCGIVGAVVWPAWFVAIVWAFTGASRQAEPPPVKVMRMPGESRPIATTFPDDR